MWVIPMLLRFNFLFYNALTVKEVHTYSDHFKSMKVVYCYGPYSFLEVSLDFQAKPPSIYIITMAQ